MSARRPVALIALVAGSLAGCASTTIDTSVSTTIAGSGTTSTAPLPIAAGSDLQQMVELATGLGDLIAAGGTDDDEALTRIHALWDNTGSTLDDNDPPLFREVEHQLGLLDIAVEKHRPADADKAARNLGSVVTTYLDRHPG